MTRQSPSLPWPQIEERLESAHRADLVQLGVWMFLATVVMLFAALTSAYIVRRSGSDWIPIELPRILWANTVILIASSMALEGGRRAASRHGNPAMARYGVSTAAGLGLLFLAGQIASWRALVARGVYLPTSPHSSFFFVLTGAHAVHVVAGLILLIYTTSALWMANVNSQRSKVIGGELMVGARLDGEATVRLLTASATFWHFLAALWFYVFVLVTMF
jgi:cytochrome c oxidase subunit 3